MKFKHLLMSGLIAALAGFFVVGCNENPDDPGNGNGNGDDVVAPSNLQAVSMSATSVGLMWTASTTAGVTYTVKVTEGSSSVTTIPDIATTTHTVSGLTEGTVYVFTVIAVDADDHESDPITVTWAPASRYTQDADNTTMEINIYEFDSPNGSGLILDPITGGPSTESMSASNPNIGDVQFAFNINGDGTFSFGPSFGYPTTIFQAADETDQNVFISDQAFTTTGLDAWYMNAPLTSLITNKQAPFTNLQEERTDGNGYAFAVRTGASAANYRYARIFLKPGGNGKIVRGTAPNRFINLVISYQNFAGIPYAKPN
jgi:hypothetical protein